MSISFPRTDILTAAAFADQTFQLTSRQETSRTAGGVTLAKDLGSALWVASYTTDRLPNDDALAYEAALNSLDGAVQSFEARDLRRSYPRSYPTGSGANDGTLLSVNANNKALALSGLVAGQVVSAGDYLSFTYGSSRALHQAMESVTANGSGTTAQFEVRPHIRAGYTLSVAVTLKLPSGIFMLVPGSVSSRIADGLFSVVSFQAMQSLV